MVVCDAVICFPGDTVPQAKTPRPYLELFIAKAHQKAPVWSCARTQEHHAVPLAHFFASSNTVP